MAFPENPDALRPSSAQRKLVSPERLLELLNQRLEAYGHCRDCRLMGPIRPLREPEMDGRNWSRFIPLVCSARVGAGCVRLAERIIDDATREYNLLGPNSPPDDPLRRGR